MSIKEKKRKRGKSRRKRRKKRVERFVHAGTFCLKRVFGDGSQGF